MESIQIFIARLPNFTTCEDLNRNFKKFGEIIETKLKNNYGFISYKTMKSAKKAILNMDGKKINGKRVIVEFSENFIKKNRLDQGPEKFDKCYNCRREGHWAIECRKKKIYSKNFSYYNNNRNFHNNNNFYSGYKKKNFYDEKKNFFYKKNFCEDNDFYRYRNYTSSYKKDYNGYNQNRDKYDNRKYNNYNKNEDYKKKNFYQKFENYEKKKKKIFFKKKKKRKNNNLKKKKSI